MPDPTETALALDEIPEVWFDLTTRFVTVFRRTAVFTRSGILRPLLPLPTTAPDHASKLTSA